MVDTLCKLVSVTPDAEATIAYCARVSSGYQDNPEYAGLLKYMIRSGHWSPFEMADMVVEITTSRAIAPQILRHRSFTFQEFSQRYAEVDGGYELYHGRRQDTVNRQNSIDDMSVYDQEWFKDAQREIANLCFERYKEAIDMGFAKESARFLLPVTATTRIYMHGTVRSWIHYLSLRTPEHGTQKEHADLVAQMKEIFIEQFPIISEALEWVNQSTIQSTDQ